MEAFFHEVVSGRDGSWSASCLRRVLKLLSFPYSGLIRSRNWFYDRGLKATHRLGIPVISVGNLTLGGTGKTPLVQFLCRELAERSARVVVLSRGYRAEGGQNDESLLLAENLPDVPHLQGKDRLKIAHEAIETYHPDVIVLDDGFQHRRLARTIDIVLVDCTNPFGYGRVFPSGLLREPQTGLGRANLIALTRTDLVDSNELGTLHDQLSELTPGVPIVETSHSPTELTDYSGTSQDLSLLKSKRVAAFCGIGNPAAFWSTLRQTGAQVVGHRAFADHHNYSAEDLEKLAAWVWSLHADMVLTTQKDLVKIRQASIAYRPLQALKIELSLQNGADALSHRLDDLVGPKRQLRLRAA